MSEMNTIAAAVNSYLSDKDYNYTWDEDKELFTYSVWFKGVIKKVNFAVDIRDSNCRSYAILPIGPDPKDPQMMQAMCELLTRINFILLNGNFEMDMSDGEIRYKVFVDCEDIIPSREIIASAIKIPQQMLYRYNDAIFNVLAGKQTPAEAMEAVENEERQFDSRLDALMAQLMAKAADNSDTDTEDSSIDGETEILSEAEEEAETDENNDDDEDSSMESLEAKFQALLGSMTD